MKASKQLYFFLILLLTSCQSTDDTTTCPLTISFTGDILLDRNVGQKLDSLGTEWLISASYLPKSDFVIGNFESPATENGFKRAKRFTFNSNPKYLSVLKKIGFTHLTLTNNHSIDCGRTGLTSTVKNIIENKMKVLGYGVTKKEACEPTIIMKNGIEIALFSSVTIPLEYYKSLENKPSICQNSPNDIAQKIKTFKKSNPNQFIIVQLHWGTEYESKPSNTQKQQAHKLIEAGANIIIGHHPHVIQTVEKYKKGVIFYSIGNYIFDLAAPKTHLGIIPTITINSSSSYSYKIDTVNLSNFNPTLVRSK